MKNINLATRYAKALYTLATDSSEQDAVFSQMRILSDVFKSDNEISNFLFTPLVRPAEKVAAIEKLVATLNISGVLKSFLALLAKKGRLGVFTEIQIAYEMIADEAHGVTRGTVRSASILGAEDRARIESLVSKATKKQVILTYKEEPSLVGGLVAEVGSFTFDDSLISHLKRINEQLTRSTH